jgi:hypothetical protein
MGPEQYAGRPPKQLDLIVIRADGERDLAVIATLAPSDGRSSERSRK